MGPTWFERDLPVLDAAAALLEGGNFMVSEGELVEATGFDQPAVRNAIVALCPEYIERTTDLSGYLIKAVTAVGRRAIGQWPTGESLVNQLVEGLTAAAEKEPDPEQKQRLHQVVGFFGGAGRSIMINLGSAIVNHHVPGAH